MSLQAAELRTAVRSRRTPALAALLVGIAVLGLIFREEAQAAVQTWRASTAYGHCWLVLPIALWLAWERRGVLGARAPAPAIWAALLACPVAIAWAGAALLGIMEGRQLAAVGCVELLAMAVLGWRLWWALSPAWLYLFFLVPFGGFLVGPLQAFTAAFIGAGLDLLRIPHQITALQIEIPDGTFYVAEACAGLRFLIASIAFGVLYAVTMFRSPGRRAAFIAVACVVPVVANGLRGLGIVVLGDFLGSAQAAVADHLIYGWVFFSAVIVALALAGMPFRQAPAATLRAIAERPAAPRRVALAGAAVVLVAAAGPALGLYLDRLAEPAAGPSAALLATPAACTSDGAEIAGAVATQRFTCGEAGLLATTTRLPRRANPSSVIKAGSGAAIERLGGDLDGSYLDLAAARPRRWAVLIDHDTGRAIAYTVWADDRQIGGGLRDRLHLAGDLLRGGAPSPVAVVVSAQGGGDAAAALRGFLDGQGDLSARAAALAAAD